MKKCFRGNLALPRWLKIPFWRQSAGSSPAGGIAEVHNCTLVRAIVGFFVFAGEMIVKKLTERDFSREMGEFLSVKRMDKQGKIYGQNAQLTVQQVFEKFQRHNRVKNLSPGTIEYYEKKSKGLFDFLMDIKRTLDSSYKKMYMQTRFRWRSRKRTETSFEGSKCFSFPEKKNAFV